MIGSALRGAARREQREYEKLAISAKWVGSLAQADPRKQPSVDKMLGKRPDRRVMAGKEITHAMRAWVSRTNSSRAATV